MTLVAEAVDAERKAAAFPFGSAWTAGTVRTRALRCLRVWRHRQIVAGDIAGHGALSLRVVNGRVTDGLDWWKRA